MLSFIKCDRRQTIASLQGGKDRLELAGPQNQLILPPPFLLEETGIWEEEVAFPKW